MTVKTATQAANAEAGVHGAGDGLYLRKLSDEPGSGSWVYRFRLGGKRREMGLGPLARLSLADARKKARTLAAQRDEGRGPIEARHKEKADNLAASRAASPTTFRQAAEAYLKDFAPTWKHRRAVQDWLNPIVRYAFPVIGELPLDEIQVEHVRAVLRAAIKAGAPENARRVRMRIESVLDDAELRGQRDPARRNPAEAKAHAFAKRSKGERPHYRRLPLDDAPAAFRAIQERAETDSRYAAWAFMIATAARPGEALGAQWSEVDLERKLWTVPAARMKGGKAHVAPLSSLALAILERQAGRRTGDAIFPGRSGSPLAYARFATAPAEAKINAATPHSWRSVFRDWCGDVGRIDRDLAEAALAHSLGAVEGSYRRESAIEARRPVMEAYARWLTGGGANVVAFPARAGGLLSCR
jgi:integrase